LGSAGAGAVGAPGPGGHPVYLFRTRVPSWTRCAPSRGPTPKRPASPL